MKKFFDKTVTGEWFLDFKNNTSGDEGRRLDSLSIQSSQLKELGDFLTKILEQYSVCNSDSQLSLICNADGIIDGNLQEFIDFIEQGKKRVRPSLSLSLDPCFFVNKLAGIIKANGTVETLLMPFKSPLLNDRINSFLSANIGTLLLVDLNVVQSCIKQARVMLFENSSHKKHHTERFFITGMGYASQYERNKNEYLTNLSKEERPKISNDKSERWLKETLQEACSQSGLDIDKLSNEDTFFVVCCKVPQFNSSDKLWLSSRMKNTGINNSNVIYISMACASVAFGLKIAIEMLSPNKYNRCVVVAAEYPNDMEKISMLSLLALSPDNKLLPFDIDRNGTALGYGAGAIIVEKSVSAKCSFAVELEDVQTKIGDLTSAKVDTNIVSELIEQIQDIRKTDLYIAHATGTKQGDEAEWTAVNSIDFVKKIPVWANKGYCKHLLYASGMPSICAAILFMKYGVVPKIKGLNSFAFSSDHCFPLMDSFSEDINNVVLGMFGFSGCNAVMKLKKI